MSYHSLAFFMGGFLFILGTGCYIWYPDTYGVDNTPGILYTVGSCGFLYVGKYYDCTQAQRSLRERHHTRSL